MLDMKDNGKITWQEYEDFWINQLQMYSEFIHVKVEHTAEFKEQSKQSFDVIAQGAESFDLQMFIKAKQENEEMLEWINEPELLL